jgi:hypothetical protein
MNLPSELQRVLPYVAVAVLAVVGLFLVMRGVGSDSEVKVPENPAPIQRDGTPPPKDSPSQGSGGAGKAQRPAAPAKRSARAYVTCVDQAQDPAALERCQALLPRR